MSSNRYPLYDCPDDELQLPSGRSVRDLDTDRLARGEVDENDLGIRADVLRRQADVAESNGFRALAENLRRAAELVAVPDEEVLEIYDALRPGRGGAAQLDRIASRLEAEYHASLTAKFVREAADHRRGDESARSSGTPRSPRR